MVSIGDRRSVYLRCSGTGSPTVVPASGTGDASDEETRVIDPAHPAAEP
ncbi:hypothetical protein [Streptomyces sp. NPDC096324]